MAATAQGVASTDTPRRVGIYGGTFDPIHIGHLIAAVEVRYALGLDHLYFMPAGQPPHKDRRDVSASAHRARMIELAIAGRPGLSLSTLDLEATTPSYTVDLLSRLRVLWPADELYFVLGEDSLRDFPRWRAPAAIAALAHLAVVTRPNVAVDLDAVVAAVPALASRVHCIAIPQIDVSSRDLRARVATGQPIAYQTTAEIEAYIAIHRLYQPE